MRLFGGWKGVVVLFCLLGAAIWALNRLSRADVESSRDSRPLANAAERTPDPAAAEESSANGPAAKLPAGISEEDYRRAETWYHDKYPDSDPEPLDVYSMGGELAVADGEYERAVHFFRQIPSTHPRYGMAARLQEGTSLVELNRAVEAEANLREYLSIAKTQPRVRIDNVIAAYKWLNFILGVELRLEDRKSVLAEVHEFGLADILDSKQYFFPNLLLLNSPLGRQRIAQFVEASPGDLQLLVAQARYKTLEGSFEAAAEDLEPLWTLNPRDTRVAAALLEVYFEADQSDRFAEVAQRLPPYDADEPWLLTRMRGEFAMQQGSWEEALRMFHVVLREDPANAPAQMSLVRCLDELGETEAHQAALEKSSVLAQIRVSLTNVSDALEAVTQLADRCEEIGFDAAARVFRLHADVIRRQQAGGAPAVPPANESSP